MAILLAGVAWAQAVDAHGFVLAAFDADVRDPLVVRRPGAFERHSGFAGAVFEYAKQPAVGRGPGGEPVPWIDDLFVLNLSAGVAPHPRLRVDLALPAYGFTGTGADGAARGGAGVGDARLTALIALVRPTDEGLGIGLVPHLDLPTGRFHGWLGRRHLGGGGAVAATYERGPLTLGAEAGAQLETRRPGSDPAAPRARSALTGGLAVGWLLDPDLGLTAELHGQAPLGQGRSSAPLEALASLRHGDSAGAHFLAGAALGLTDAVGVASFRVFAGGGFGARAGPRDRDKDGIPDLVDRCPDVPETPNGYRDDDGCPDLRPTLRARVLRGGEPAVGATLRIEGPVTRQLTVGPEPFTMDVDPGSVWRGSARLGPCLVGERVVSAGESALALDVPLALDVRGVIVVQAVDADGQPVGGATVRVRPDTPGCAPEHSFRTDGRGEVRIEVGAGRHTVGVEHGDRRGTATVQAEGRESVLPILLGVSP